jgi:hypothetical protein
MCDCTDTYISCDCGIVIDYLKIKLHRTKDFSPDYYICPVCKGKVSDY